MFWSKEYHEAKEVAQGLPQFPKFGQWMLQKLEACLPQNRGHVLFIDSGNKL
jgi:hypothetical protein